MTAILNAKKSRQDRETLPISSSIELSDARYFLNDDFKKRQETTNFPYYRICQLHCFGNNRS